MLDVRSWKTVLVVDVQAVSGDSVCDVRAVLLQEFAVRSCGWRPCEGCSFRLVVV